MLFKILIDNKYLGQRESDGGVGVSVNKKKSQTDVWLFSFGY
ncbi:hypothetical protein [Chryseobacterium joostei]